MKRIFMWTIGVCVFLTCNLRAADRFAFSPNESSLTVYVPRAGLLSVLGHDHTIKVGHFDGTLEMDRDNPETAQIRLTILAGSLAVADEDVSEETRSKIETEMRGDDVLQQEAHPEIFFESMEVIATAPGEWEVRGALTVRGVTRPVKVPAKVAFLSGGRFEATGLVKVKPEIFGIKPVRALGGAIRTASTIEIRFDVSGSREAG
jgi:polyisoprenoid-binding protein YceI